jgi:hypothetical protein
MHKLHLSNVTGEVTYQDSRLCEVQQNETVKNLSGADDS